MGSTRKIHDSDGGLFAVLLPQGAKLGARKREKAKGPPVKSCFSHRWFVYTNTRQHCR